MSPGRKPATNRALSRRFTAGTPVEKVEFLRARLECLIQGLRLFASYCDLAPSELRSEIKQFVDLADIELREGLKALRNGTKALSEAGLLSEQAPVTASSDDSLATARPAEVVSPQELQAEDSLLESSPESPISNLNPLGMSFDSMAQMAEVPEAGDLEAILARLQSYGEALDNADIEGGKVGPQSGRDARELLLGFEVCRMDSNSTDAAPEQIVENQASNTNGDWPNTKTFATSSDATSLTTQYTEVVQLDSDSPAANSSISLTPAEENSSVSDSGVPGFASADGEDSLSQTTSAENDSLQGKSETESRAPSNPHPSRESKREQSENSNPVNSISPDNLLEINALKEELSAMLSQFKSTGATSSSP